MLSDDVKIVDGAWGSIGMSRPEYLAWQRIKTALAELGTTPNTARDAIAADLLNQWLKYWHNAPGFDRDSAFRLIKETKSFVDSAATAPVA